MLEVPVGTAATGLALGSAQYVDVKPVNPATAATQLKNGFTLDMSTTLATWIEQAFTIPGVPEAGLDEDPNRNGIPNLLEFVYGQDPVQAAPGQFPLTQMAIVQDNGIPVLEMTFIHRNGTILGDFETGFMIDGVTLLPECSQSLGPSSLWESGAAVFTQSGSVIVLDEQTRQYTIRLKQSLDSPRFVRQRADAN
jgi:hypothetical protein